MRVYKKSSGGLEVKAFSGTYVILLGFNVPDEVNTKDFLGFALFRKDHEEQEQFWLKNRLSFDIKEGEVAELSTLKSPVQKFRWGDYTVKPKRKYTYKVMTVHGKPGNLEYRDSLEITIDSEDPKNVGGEHQVHFNRAAAASQAYVAKFGNQNPEDVPGRQAFTWLSRGLEESLIDFIRAAKTKSHSLFCCIYEFQKPEFLAELKKLTKKLGPDQLVIIYDNCKPIPGDENLESIHHAGLEAYCHERTKVAISHNKFMVRCYKGKPVAVWTGSTNWTDGGIYGQANVGHAIEDKNLAAQYLEIHKQLLNNPATKDLKVWIKTNNAVPDIGTKLYTIFSPRSNTEALERIGAYVAKAQELVCFTAPFSIHASIEDVLDNSEDQFIKLGLLNKSGNVVEKVKNTENNLLSTANKLNQLDNFQKESFHRRGIFIHTKFFLIDPLSSKPIVISGSANFSNNSCVNNDENQLFIQGEKAVADVYFTEFMRVFDHYAFRSRMKEAEEDKKKITRLFLSSNNNWSKKYFIKGSLSEKERLIFSRR